MQDTLTRATACNGQIRAFAATTTNLVEEARQRHNTAPTTTAALGRALSASLLLGAMLKQEEFITLKIEGNGPLGLIIAEATHNGKARGYVRHPYVDLPLKNGKLDVGGAIGKEGTLYVIRDTGLRQTYSGSVPLVSGEIGDDITHYLYTSDQIPSVVGVGVLVSPDLSVLAAGGFVVQVMPGAEENRISQIEKNIQHLSSPSTMVQQGLRSVDIIQQLLKGMDIVVHTTHDLQFKCRCSLERATNALISLGHDELLDMAKEGKAELNCHYCNTNYTFNSEQLNSLAEGINTK